jgi:hypothetical protein
MMQADRTMLPHSINCLRDINFFSDLTTPFGFLPPHHMPSTRACWAERAVPQGRTARLLGNWHRRPTPHPCLLHFAKMASASSSTSTAACVSNAAGEVEAAKAPSAKKEHGGGRRRAAGQDTGGSGGGGARDGKHNAPVLAKRAPAAESIYLRALAGFCRPKQFSNGL